MKLESVRELKAALFESVVVPMATSMTVRSAGLRAQPMEGLAPTPPTVALGATRGARGEWALAVRLQKRALETSPQVETIRKRARGEVDVRYIGQVTKRAGLPWHQKRCRPLKIGCSIGHFKITAGTLGGFVRSRGDGAVLMLSNNHVFANEGKARKGDAILQPGSFDGGENPRDRVGELLRFVRLNRTRPNLADAAVATIDPAVKFDSRTLTGIGTLTGPGDAALLEDGAVRKVGRTTGVTAGRVSAFELDGVIVEFGLGFLRFDDQVEIESDGSGPFSQGGDSGSLIVDAEARAVGLLFAGSELGGSNGLGLTFANPLRAVLDALKVDLFLA